MSSVSSETHKSSATAPAQMATFTLVALKSDISSKFSDFCHTIIVIVFTNMGYMVHLYWRLI